MKTTVKLTTMEIFDAICFYIATKGKNPDRDNVTLTYSEKTKDFEATVLLNEDESNDTLTSSVKGVAHA